MKKTLFLFLIMCIAGPAFAQKFVYGVSPVIFPAKLTRPVDNSNQSVQLYGVNTYLEFELAFNDFVSLSGGGNVMNSAHVTDLTATTIQSYEVYQDTFISFNKTTGWIHLLELKNIPLMEDQGTSIVIISPGLGGEYTREERLDQVQFNWQDGAIFHILASKLRSEYNSIYPFVKCDFQLRLSPVKINLGFKASPAGISWKKLIKFSTTSYTAYQSEVYNIELYENSSPFLSTLLGAHGGLDIDGGGLGDISLDVSALVSIGTSNITGFTWNKTTATRDEFSAQETNDKSVLLKGDLFYNLTFIDLGGLIPMVHIAYEKKTLQIDGSQVNEMSYDRFDFGVAFRY